jgi:hypothetical protein
MEKTFDIYFADNHDSNNLGFTATFDFCLNYINRFRGTNHSYFEDYKSKGSYVYIICNETGAEEYSIQLF